MSTGLNPNTMLIEREQAAVAVATLAQPFIAPCDLDVVGLLAVLGTTAPGAGDGVVINLNDSPTSQLASVSPYNLWTTANAPSILGTSKNSFTTTTAPTVIENSPYPFNYPSRAPRAPRGTRRRRRRPPPPRPPSRPPRAFRFTRWGRSRCRTTPTSTSTG